MKQSTFLTAMQRLMLLLAFAWTWTLASADVTVWVQASSAPKLFVFNTNGTCSGTESGTAFSSYTTWSGATMSKYVTTSDNKTWYYEVFTGLNSASVIFNNGSSQTDDITGVSGTKYYYYNGSTKYIDITSCKNAAAYCFLETSTTYWEQANARFQVWDGSADVWMTQVGGIRGGGKIYLYTKTSSVSDGTTFYFKRMSSDGNSKWNEGSASYHLGGYYTNTGWSNVSYQSGSSFGSIVWPEVPAVPQLSATVYVYDPTGTAPTLNGNAMTTVDGNNCVWYTGTVTGTSLATTISGSGTLNTTLNDGQTYYYYWNGSNYVATTADYNPWAGNSFNIYVSTADGTAPYLYLWYNIGNTQKRPNGDWPGNQMTGSTTTINGYNYYVYSVNGIEKVNAIVNNKSGKQTSDINNISTDWYILFDPSASTPLAYSESTPKPEAQVDVYLLGGTLGNDWSTGTKMISSDNNIYTLTDVELYNPAYFRFRDSDGNQYAPDADGTQITVGTAQPMSTFSSTSNSFLLITTGIYTIEVNRSAKTVKLTKTGDITLTLTMLGDMFNWDTGQTMTTTDNVTYTLNNVNIGANQYFRFKLSNGIQLYPETGGAEAFTDGTPNQMESSYGQTNNAFKITTAGTYNFTVNTEDCTVTITRNISNFYLMSNHGGSWNITQGEQFTIGNNNAATLSGVNLDYGDYYFFSSALASTADGWNDIINYRYGPANGTTTVLSGTTYTATSNQNSYQPSKTGVWTFDYNLNNNQWTGTLTAANEHSKWYLVTSSGADSFGWHAPHEMTRNGNTFTYTRIMNKGDYFIFAQQVGNDWNSSIRYTCDGDEDVTINSNRPYTATRHGSKAYKIGTTGTWTFSYNYLTDEWTATFEAINVNTGELYLIGQANGNPWHANAGLKMIQSTENGKTYYKLEGIQILNGATFAFASKLSSDENDWNTINAYRYDANIENGQYWVTEAMTDRDEPTHIGLKPRDNNDCNFEMHSGTGRYTVIVNWTDKTFTITRDYDALYMFYGNSQSPYWKPNAGVPMITTDGKNYTLSGVSLRENDTFQFATQLGNDENTWPDNQYRLGANAQVGPWEVTTEQIGIVLENALLAGSTKDFKMDPDTDGTYRVVANPTEGTVALYPMAQVLGSKVILHLEQANVTTPTLWAYDKERDATNKYYLHVDRPTRDTIANRRHMFADGVVPVEAKIITTADGRKWWTWEVDNSIVDFWFTRGNYTYNLEDDENPDMTDIQWRKSGEIFLTWPSTGTALEEYTRDYYAAAAQEAADCAVMIEGHEYAYFTNTPGWDNVFCHAWYTDASGVNHDLLTPPSPYEGNPCYPGALCELIGYDKDGYEVWRIDLTAAGVTQYPNGGILFNNGIDDKHQYEHSDMNHDYYTGGSTTAAKEQSGDFTYSTGTCYDYCGVIVLGRSLGNIIRNGVLNGPVYTIEEDLVAVYCDENEVTEIEVNVNGTIEKRYTYGALYCKDMNNFVTTQYVEKSLQQEGQIDYMRNYYTFYGDVYDGYPERPDRYDQSNWVKLTFSTLYPGIAEMNESQQISLLKSYEGKILPKESIKGQLVNNFNPEMHLAQQALPQGCTSTNYTPNVFITSSFIGSQTGTDHSGDTYDMFFVTPKPQEYAAITWALYNGNNEFVICESHQYDFDQDGTMYYYNGFDLDGFFKIKWDLQENPNEDSDPYNDLMAGQLYQFVGIIRLAEGTEGESSNTRYVTNRDITNSLTPKPYEDNAHSSQYIVSPINLSHTGDHVITGVNDMNDNTFKQVKSIQYIDVTGKVSNRPFDGVNIVMTRFTDGSVSTTKIIR